MHCGGVAYAVAVLGTLWESEGYCGDVRYVDGA